MNWRTLTVQLITSFVVIVGIWVARGLGLPLDQLAEAAAATKTAVYHLNIKMMKPPLFHQKKPRP